MRLPADPSVGLLIRLVVGTVFLFTGSSKMVDLGEFADAIRLYRLIPGVTAGAAARVVATVEVALGTALLLGAVLTWASTVGIALLVIFTFAITVNLIRGRRIPCGCKHQATEPIQVKHIVRNVAAIAALACLATLPVHPWALDQLLRG